VKPVSGEEVAMKYRIRAGDLFFDGAIHLIIAVVVLVTIYPFLYVLFASFSNPTDISNYKGILLAPIGFTLEPYRYVFMNPDILTGYKNTIIYVVLGTAINMIMTTLGAFVLSRKHLGVGNALMVFVVITMFFSGGLVPSYLLVSRLGMIDTVWAIVIPPAISTWNMIIMRTSFQGIPTSLEESAKIDGANDLQFLFKIILPLSMPIIAIMVLFYGVSHWNNWFSAILFLRKRSMFPIQVFLRELLILDINSITNPIGGEFNTLKMKLIVQYAIVIVTTVPVLFIYPFIQKYFTKGVMIGALKG
jgi:putative aldouronate transport system permease protein